jgi:hypothetical protein
MQFLLSRVWIRCQNVGFQTGGGRFFAKSDDVDVAQGNLLHHHVSLD